jgi:hypothetical protein
MSKLYLTPIKWFLIINWLQNIRLNLL